jgi:hypothetical protein
MILSHRHKFIFFAVPKTATHAVRFALRPLLGEEDEEQVGLYVNKSLSLPALNTVNHGHLTALQAQAALPENVWNSYYKFAFVRNPFDRFVSFGFYMNRKSRTFKKNTTEKLKGILKQERNTSSILFTPQHKFLCDDQNKVMMDFVGKFENFNADFAKACAHLNLPAPELEHFNATRHDHFSEYYDNELSAAVTSIYAKDFEIFGY